MRGWPQDAVAGTLEPAGFSTGCHPGHSVRLLFRGLTYLGCKVFTTGHAPMIR